MRRHLTSTTILAHGDRRCLMPTIADWLFIHCGICGVSREADRKQLCELPGISMDFATQLCSLMGLIALVQAFLPDTVRGFLEQALQRLWARLFGAADLHAYVDVVERSIGGSHNALYSQVAVYLGSLDSALSSQDHLNAHRDDVTSPLSFTLPVNETLSDTYDSVPVWWTHTCRERDTGRTGSGGGLQALVDEERILSLKFLKKDRDRVLPAYLLYISKVAADIEHRNTQRHLYTNSYGGWQDVPFNHPSTFETLALEGDLVERVQADLRAFSDGEEYYHKIGRAWKRGYLLYGPPGTGKSSMIAAMSNFLNYDVYDVELTKVTDNTELKSLLMQTTRRSIIVIEDVDCTVDLSDRSKTKDSDDGDVRGGGGDSASKLTLSGLLNFTDGLWSCCGEERIFVFTTNHKERLDPALLRSGRMDMHILLSYCTFSAFQKMVRNYLGITRHPLFADVENAISAPCVQLTPAEVAEVLMRFRDNPDAAIGGVLVAIGRAQRGVHADVVQQLAYGSNEVATTETIKASVDKPTKGRNKLSLRRLHGRKVGPAP